MTIAFLDCETTGLDPTRHVPWEIGLVIGDEEYNWTLELTPEEGANADSGALRLTDYHARRKIAETGARWRTKDLPRGGKKTEHVLVADRKVFADDLVAIIGTRHLGGMVVAFDERRIGDFLRRQGFTPAWHYHLVDVECIAAGKLGWEPPWRSNDLSIELGVDYKSFGRHTALGDARWAKAVYEAAMGH